MAALAHTEPQTKLTKNEIQAFVESFELQPDIMGPMWAKAKLRTRVGDRIVGVEGPARVQDDGNVVILPETMRAYLDEIRSHEMVAMTTESSIWHSPFDIPSGSITGSTITFNSNIDTGYVLRTSDSTTTDSVWRFPTEVGSVIDTNFGTAASTGTVRILYGTGTDIRYYDSNGEFINPASPTVWPKTADYIREQRRRKLRNQWMPSIAQQFGRRPRAVGSAANFRDSKQNELVALQLLRSMVSPDVFRKYLKYGFVTVPGPSGLSYQITRKSHIITVWDHGEKFATLCVYLKDHTIPPTDEVVAKMLIVECDEPDIWERANISWYTQRPLRIAEVCAFLGRPIPGSVNRTRRLDFGGNNTQYDLVPMRVVA